MVQKLFAMFKNLHFLFKGLMIGTIIVVLLLMVTTQGKVLDIYDSVQERLDEEYEEGYEDYEDSYDEYEDYGRDNDDW